MWVIIVSENLAEGRNSILDSILDDKKTLENYLTKRSGQKNWYPTSAIQLASTWKTLSGAKRVIDSYSKQQFISDWRLNKFLSLKGKHLQARKITNQEWNSIIDHKLIVMKMRYERQKSQLEAKKKI